MTIDYSAASITDWHAMWHEVATWMTSKGLHIVMLVIGSIVAARLIRWTVNSITGRLDQREGDALVRSEATKHRTAAAGVISWVAIVILYVVVAVEITSILGLPVGSLVAPAAVLGAALGFGGQRLVQDLLSGFFIITEKQYGFGDLARLTVSGATKDATGTVEDVTLRVTKLRDSDGEMVTVPNGQIVQAVNLSKDWARAVIDIPVPASADVNRVNDVLRQVAAEAINDDAFEQLLLDEPSLMGVESIEVDAVNVRMVARTLPGKQFEVGRRLRLLVVESLSRAGIATPGDSAPTVEAIEQSNTVNQDVHEDEEALQPSGAPRG